MSAVTLFMLRHGAHDAVDRVLCGRMDGVALGPVGRLQADALARRLASENLAAVYSSPIQRARETAAPVARRRGLEPLEEDALTEIDFGRWMGLRFDELDGRPDWRDWNERRDVARPPGGESMAEVQARLAAWMNRLRERHPGRSVAAVSHCDVIRACVCLALGLSLRSLLRFAVDPGSMTTLALHDAGETLLALNEVPFNREARRGPV